MGGGAPNTAAADRLQRAPEQQQQQHRISIREPSGWGGVGGPAAAVNPSTETETDGDRQGRTLSEAWLV